MCLYSRIPLTWRSTRRSKSRCSGCKRSTWSDSKITSCSTTSRSCRLRWQRASWACRDRNRWCFCRFSSSSEGCLCSHPCLRRQQRRPPLPATSTSTPLPMYVTRWLSQFWLTNSVYISELCKTAVSHFIFATPVIFNVFTRFDIKWGENHSIKKILSLIFLIYSDI